jgi:hypothetical protein
VILYWSAGFALDPRTAADVMRYTLHVGCRLPSGHLADAVTTLIAVVDTAVVDPG